MILKVERPKQKIDFQGRFVVPVKAEPKSDTLAVNVPRSVQVETPDSGFPLPAGFFRLIGHVGFRR